MVTDEDVATSRGMVAKKAELRDTTHEMSRLEGTAKTRGVAHETFSFIEAKTQGAPPWGAEGSLGCGEILISPIGASSGEVTRSSSFFEDCAERSGMYMSDLRMNSSVQYKHTLTLPRWTHQVCKNKNKLTSSCAIGDHAA